MRTLLLSLFAIACSPKFHKTVDHVDRDRFMGKWHVQAGRFTFLENGAHNAVESYVWNEKEKRIDIDFTFNKDALDGEVKSVPQKGWIYNEKTNAHWKVSPFWPLKFDYLIIGIDPNYEWTAVGVPNQKYLWIMTREKNVTRDKIESILTKIRPTGYPIDDLTYVPHSAK